MEYDEALSWLYGTQLTGIKLGLENIHRLLGTLGLADFDRHTRILHVAGTNGKGSVCAMIDAVSRASGRSTGLFTSPHLVSFQERIRINGEPVSRQSVAEGLNRLCHETAAWTPAPTFFELTTALAALCFKQAGVEVVAWETGLGGRLDATNAVVPAASVLTAIDLDHKGFLGDTLALVAGEKAGIIKPGVPVISGPQLPEAAAVIAAAAREKGAPLQWITEPIEPGVPVALPGSHQRVNASVALAALEAAGIAAKPSEAREGLGSVQWPGRFQRFEGGQIILDGAHNPAAARRLTQTWREEFGEGSRATLIFGVLQDKEFREICRALAPIAARVLAVPPVSPRALPVAELRDVWLPFAEDKEIRTEPDLASALDRARLYPEPILVAGSLFLVGEALSLLEPGGEHLEISWQ